MRTAFQPSLLLALSILAADWNPVAAADRTSAADQDAEVFLFSFFRGNGEHGVYLAWSEDGFHFQSLNDDRPICPPAHWPGQQLTRDPSILYRDGTFRMVWTSNWEGRVFGYRESSDLVHWSDPIRVAPFPEILPTEDQPGNVWAPEIQWDPVERNDLIVWSSTTPRERNDGDGSENQPGHRLDHRIYSCRTTDGKSFTPARKFFDQGFSVIDAFLAYDDQRTADVSDDRWVMVLKQEQDSDKNLRLTFAKPGFARGWSPVSQPIVGPGSPIRPQEKAEGPCLLRDKAGKRWLLYWDAFANGHPGLATSEDLRRWTDRTEELRLPRGARHGTVFQAPRSAVGFPLTPSP